MEAQFADLSNNPDVIVATPGRLLHHVDEVKAFTLRSVCHVVLDEADRLLEMGFADQLKQIMSSVADVRQTLLFSATLPSALASSCASACANRRSRVWTPDENLFRIAHVVRLVTKRRKSRRVIVHAREVIPARINKPSSSRRPDTALNGYTTCWSSRVSECRARSTVRWT